MKWAGRGITVGQRVDDFIEAYESAQARDGTADLEQFLPGREHPLYRAVLRELVRVDLEYGWQRGKPQGLEHYLTAFPDVVQHRADVQDIAFEEYRLRRQAGEDPDPAEYRQRFAVNTDDWPRTPPTESPTAPRHDADEESLSRAARVYREGPHGPEEATAGSPADAVSWQLFQDLHQADPHAAQALAEAVASWPTTGADFLGFRLLTVLGKGAFSRVYLARQGQLANRPVVLKITTHLFQESQALSRLQHTNVVPIYSVHRSGPFQAVCMPYLGSTTLADVLAELPKRVELPDSGAILWKPRRQDIDQSSSSLSPRQRESMPFVEASLRLAARLADGLAHAHERGILHHDLKPANILLTDYGEPMLLDFNLAEDTTLRSNLSAAMIGGTLPYMAPEHLEAFQAGQPSADARSDLFSFGIILYELLTGQHPFAIEHGPPAQVVPRMIADRRRGPPPLRGWNPHVSPAVESIVRHCLEAEAPRRYQTARELQEDLERQLSFRPLRHAPELSTRERIRKWTRRHPLLTSTTSLTAFFGLLLLALVGAWLVRGQRLARMEAVASLTQFRADLKTAQFLFLHSRHADAAKVKEGSQFCRELLTRYHVMDDPDWTQQPSVRLLAEDEQQWLRQEVGELLLLWARVSASGGAGTAAEQRAAYQAALQLNRLAESCYAGGHVPRILWRQRGELLSTLGEDREASQARAREQSPEEPNARDLLLLAAEQSFAGRFQEALGLLQQATRLEPDNFRAWFDLGLCQENRGRDLEAAYCYSACIALWPQFAPLYFKRGCAHLRDEDFRQAVADFDLALGYPRSSPASPAAANLPEIHIQRALAWLGLRRTNEALADLTAALGMPDCPTRAYFIRARVRLLAGDARGAHRDRVQGLRFQPTEEASWLARGWARLEQDPAGALVDFEQALTLNPRSREALQNQAHVLAERLGRTAQALHVLDRLLTLYPESVPARAGRGVLRARLGQRQLALEDAVACVAADNRPRVLYQVAGIYALTSKEHSDDRQEALRLLASALRQGYGLDKIDQDRDLDLLRELPEFHRLLASVRALATPKK